MSVEVTPYATGRDLWEAVIARAKTAARSTGRPSNELLREFVYERLLARVFAQTDEPWVLKGGTALLARVDDARHSKDVDLLHSLSDVDTALIHLRRALARDMGDHFVFEIVSTTVMDQDQQAGVAGCRVDIDARVGPKSRQKFHIDLVTGSLMTGDPEPQPAPALVTVPGLVVPTYRLYPVADHVADKLCATEATYGGYPSSRVRDLVDLVVIARTQTMRLPALHAAVSGERLRRGLPVREAFSPPPGWAPKWPTLAGATPHCAGLGFRQAAALAGALLGPALGERAGEGTWDPQTTSWRL